MDHGTGIVILQLDVPGEPYKRHAISYETGMLLDPSYMGVRESYKELVARYGDRGFRVSIVNVILKEAEDLGS